MLFSVFWPNGWMALFDMQLYGEYQEHHGGSGRREATRLLTERQIKKHGTHPHSHGKVRHGHGHRSHGQDGCHGRHQHSSYNRQRNRRQSTMGKETTYEQRTEADLMSSMKKKRSYSKCRGKLQQFKKRKMLQFVCCLMFFFCRLHSTGPEIPCDQAGGRLDLPRAVRHYNGAGQLDNGLCQCKESTR